jgi:hypothetical protein
MRVPGVMAIVAMVGVGTLIAPRVLQSVDAAPRLQLAAITNDATEDADFLFRLGMMEGHLMIGHQLMEAHQAELGLPHYGHPVRELYSDIEDYLDAKHFPAFNGQLIALEAQATAAPDSPETEKTYQAVIATLHKARETTPASLRASLPQMIQICSDTIDAASGEFGQAIEQGKVTALIEYHDSKGYLAYVAQEMKELNTQHSDAESQGLLARFQAVLAKAEWIVAPLLPDPTPRASLETYRAIVAEGAAIAKE